MGLGWPAVFSPLEDGADLGLLLTSNAFSNDSLESAIIRMNARWEPTRDAETVAREVRAASAPDLAMLVVAARQLRQALG